MTDKRPELMQMMHKGKLRYFNKATGRSLSDREVIAAGYGHLLDSNQLKSERTRLKSERTERKSESK